MAVDRTTGIWQGDGTGGLSDRGHLSPFARFADGKPAVILSVTGTNTETVWIEAADERFEGIGSVSWER
jgi:hypothetical protein